MLCAVLARMRFVAVAACSAALVLAGCSLPTTGAPAAAPPDDPDAAARTLLRPAADLGTVRGVRHERAGPRVVRQPGVRVRPAGGPARLRRAGRRARRSSGVLRQQATGERIGSLVMNPGGPGASGMSLVAASLSGRARAEPRSRSGSTSSGSTRAGVGASTPTIDCLNDAEWEAERADLDVDPSPAGRRADRGGEPGVRAPVRRALRRSGRAGQRRHPRRRPRPGHPARGARRREADLPRLLLRHADRLGVRRGVPATRCGRSCSTARWTRPRPRSTSTVEQNAGFQQAFDAFAADCAQQPTCPLGTDPAQATARVPGADPPADRRPVPAAGGARTLSYPDAVDRARSRRCTCRELLADPARGASPGCANGDGTILLRAGRPVLRPRARTGATATASRRSSSISCVDEERITDRAAAGRADPPGQRGGAVPRRRRGAVAALDPCAFWPVAAHEEPHVPQVQGLPPTLVGLGDRRPGHAVPGRGGPGAGAEREPADGRGQPAHRRAAGRAVRRRRVTPTSSTYAAVRGTAAGPPAATWGTALRAVSDRQPRNIPVTRRS